MNRNKKVRWEELGIYQTKSGFEIYPKVAYENMPYEIRREFDYFTFLLSKHTGIPKEDALFLIVATVIPHTILTKKKGYSNAEALELWKCEVRNKLCGDNTFYLFQQFLDRIGAGYFDKGVS